jgi:hypothetical protein
MQPTKRWLLALAVVAGSSAALAAGRDPIEDPSTRQTAAALDALSDRIQQGHLEAADLDAVKSALRDRPPFDPPDPRAPARLARMEAALDTFVARLKRHKLVPAHVDMIREQLVDEQLDRAVERWRIAAAGGKATEEEYRAVAGLIADRAEVSRSFDPAANAMQRQLQARLDELLRRGKDKPLRGEDVADFRNALIDLRLEHSIASLEARAGDEDLTRADLARFRGILQDHALDARNDADFAAMRQRLDNAVDAIEQKVTAGTVEVSDVAALHGLLVKLSRPKDGPKPEGPKPDGG